MTKDDDDHRPGPLPREPDKDPCNESFATALAGPNPDLIRKLNQYSVLQVGTEASTIRGKTVEALVARLGDEVVGTIDDVRADALLECMTAGRSYRAVVQRIDGGYVVVRIEPIP